MILLVLVASVAAITLLAIHESPKDPKACPSCSRVNAHEFSCPNSDLAKRRAAATPDPWDDPYGRGLAEDDELDNRIGEGRFR